LSVVAIIHYVNIFIVRFGYDRTSCIYSHYTECVLYLKIIINKKYVYC